MITFQWSLTKGIFEGSQISFNEDLINFAKNKEFELPYGYYPALLTRDYLMNDFAKYRKSYTWAPEPEAWEITKEVFQLENSLRFLALPMSFDEAIGRIELSSSPGFPWNRVYATKRDVIANELPLIRSIVERVFEHGDVDYYFDGQHFTNVFWLTSPKSEIRPIAKMNHEDPTKRKTRTFMCGDLICHIVGYMLYKEQNDRFLDLALSDSWSAVGLSPWYGGWDCLARILLRNQSLENRKESKIFHCYDASHMEASVSDGIQDLIYATRNQSLPSNCENAMNWFYLNITNSLIIDIDGKVALKNGKNPSGSFNTLTDNTMALMIVFIYTIARHTKDLNLTFKALRRIACKMLGDDSIFEDCPELKDLERYSAELGFDLQPEALPGPLESCSFLSSQFVFSTKYKMWIQRNNWEKIIANVYFNFKSRSWRLAFVKLCACRQIFFAFDDKKAQIDYLLNYILVHHDEDMKNENCKELTYEQARAQYMLDSQNKFLIFGTE
nr:RNA-dependent RNA polymerase [Flumine Astrovirus 9]